MTLLSPSVSWATPIRLTIQPKGTNKVEVTFGPVFAESLYEVLVRTNGPEGHWMTFASCLGGSNKTASVVCDLGEIPGLSMQTLRNWSFAAGPWNDSGADEIPALYTELALRMDPCEPVNPIWDIAGDGLQIIYKFEHNLDPLKPALPPPPRLDVRFQLTSQDGRRGNAILTWQLPTRHAPEYFQIERAMRSLRPRVETSHLNSPGVSNGNRLPVTNRAPRLNPAYQQRMSAGEDPFVMGPFLPLARVKGQEGASSYQFIDTNVDLVFQPLYRMQAQYSPPLYAELNRLDAAGIRRSIIPVSSKEDTNGYSLTVPHSIPYACYLLLVRDKTEPMWRASGYFRTGTNREPVALHVDKKGMMSEGQAPLAMPKVKFLPAVVKPEFVAGWGEDSDGDGLPDVYEVLVTGTAPDNADTGNTGVLDGYKEMSGDGWSNLEKFRRRSNPLTRAQPPSPVELSQPTGAEIMGAIAPHSDLRYELQVEIRTNIGSTYQALEKIPGMFYRVMNFRNPQEHRNFDLRVSWKVPEPKPHERDDRAYHDLPSPEQTIESMEGKANVKLFEKFQASLASNPPLSGTDARKQMAAIEHAYRQGEIDKGVAMAESMAVEDNLSQAFFGKVLDQYGQPVADANIKAQVSLGLGGGGRTCQTKTDADGLFEFTGLRGRSLSVTPERSGFQIEGHGLGLKGLNGAETSRTNREVYTMWRLKGPEPMIHDSKFYQPKSDGRVYTLDLVSRKMVEGTNAAGDLLIQFQRPAQVKPRQEFEWSFSMTGVGGGVILVTNNDYLNEAPADGYSPDYKIAMGPGRSRSSEGTFYLKSREGKVYGHFHIRLEPVYRDGAGLDIESYVNPSGSRNLEFDPSKQVR